MPSWVPARAQAAELLDVGQWELPALRANLREMALADRMLGGRRAMLARVTNWIAALAADGRPRVLDVATGNAMFPNSLYRWSVRDDRPLLICAGDISADVLLVAQLELGKAPVGLLRYDALRLPFADDSIDIITCSQALHHFGSDTAVQLLVELARVARYAVVISDLRRSYIGYWAARLLACGPVTGLFRNDGPLSVLRAYTPDEALELARRAAVDAKVHRTPFRLLLEWEKQDRPLPAAV